MCRLLLILLFMLAGGSLAQVSSPGGVAGSFPLVGQRGASLPSTCAIGQLFFKTDATAGGNVFGCTAANTWTLQSGNGGAITPSTILVTGTTAPTVVSTSGAFYASATGGGVFQGSGSGAGLTFLSASGATILTMGSGVTTNTSAIFYGGISAAGGALVTSGTYVDNNINLSFIQNAGAITGIKMGMGTSGINMGVGFVYGLGANSSGNSPDAGLSRLGASSLAIGNGSNGSFAGSLKLTSFEAFGSNVFLSGLGAATGTPSTLCMNGTQVTVNAAQTCTVSSARFKDDIQPFALSGIDLIGKIHPATFFYKDRLDRNRIGMVAEQLAAVDPRLAEWDKDGRPNSIDFPAIMGVLVKAVQEQGKRIDDLNKRSTQQLPYTIDVGSP